MSSVLVESDCRSMLESLGFPDIVVDAWEAEGVTELLPIQKEAFAANVLDHISSLIIGPTTSGKTFIGEAACVKHALEKRRCLFLVPFKALAEEKYQEFQLKYGRPEIGADILISTADRRDRDRQLAAGDFNIAILTYEKLSALLVIHPSLLKNAGAIIVDEIQMIRAESRGAELELLLTRARQIAPDLQVIGLSAAVSELNGFDEWLGAQVVRNEHRPVPLREGVILPNGRFEYLEWQEVDKTPGVETLPSLIGETEESLAISLAAQLLEDESEQVLVFANAVSRTQGLAVAIANRVQGLVPATDTIKGLAGLENSESVEALTESLQSAVAFHNSDLTLEERLAVEAGFRHGHIRCIVSTSTLSMGVNLPASTVMIVKPTKWTREAGSWDEVPISVAEYRNMSGRAGRFGLRTDSFGRSVLIAKSPLDQKALLKRYVNGTPEPLESAFLKRPLAVFLLRVFASGLCDNPNGAQRFLLKTFAARQVWNTEESQEKLAEEIHRAISQLTVYKLVEVKDDKVHVTDLGVICASSGLQLESFGQLLSLVKSSNTSAVDIAHLASRGKDTGPDGGVGIRLSSDEYHGRRPHFVRVLRDWCTTFVGPLTELLLDRFEDGSAPTYEQGKELKYQCVAMAYVTGVASREIERQLGVSAGKARAIGSMCSWLSDTAAKAAWATGKIDEAKAFEVLAERFLYGCSEEALFLSRVPHHLHRREREQLVVAGYDTLQKLVDAEATEIAKTAQVSRTRVQRLQKAIIDLLGESLELERQQLARLQALGISGGPIEVLYTASGVPLEQAIEDILVPPFCPLTVKRITRQRTGEADLQIILSSGHNGIAQVHARENPNAMVGVVKAGAVLQQSPELKPEVFICFGRPDFDKDAIAKVTAHVKNGKNYKMIPISVLAEMHVRFHEKKLTSDRVAEILESETGYLTCDRL